MAEMARLWGLLVKLSVVVASSVLLFILLLPQQDADEPIVPSESSRALERRVKRSVQVYNYTYPGFAVELPRFVTEQSRQTFLKHDLVEVVETNSPVNQYTMSYMYDWQWINETHIGFMLGYQTHGSIKIVPNAKFVDLPHCRNITDMSEYQGYTENDVRLRKRPVRVKHALLAAHMPWPGAFSHVLRDLMPKLLQAWPHVHSGTKLIFELESKRQAMVDKVLAHLGWTRDRIVSYDKINKRNRRLMLVKELVVPCDTPGLVPELWRALSGLMRLPASVVPDVHDPRDAVHIADEYWASQGATRNTIVYMERRGGMARGKRDRLVSNNDEVIAALKDTFPEYPFTVFNHTHFDSVEALARFFSSARLIVSPHQGAMYNMFFAPPGTPIVEIMPSDKHLGGRLMLYYTASFLGHPYYRIQVNQTKAMHAPVGEILDAVRAALATT